MSRLLHGWRLSCTGGWQDSLERRWRQQCTKCPAPLCFSLLLSENLQQKETEREKLKRERCSEGVGLDGSLLGPGVILNTHPFFYLTTSLFPSLFLSAQPLNHYSLALTFYCHMHGKSSMKFRAKGNWVGGIQAHYLNPQKRQDHISNRHIHSNICKRKNLVNVSAHLFVFNMQYCLWCRLGSFKSFKS